MLTQLSYSRGYRLCRNSVYCVELYVIDTAREIVKKLSPPRIAAPRARTRKADSAACLASSPDKRSLVEKADDQKRKNKTKVVRTASGKKHKTKKQATPESRVHED